MYTRQAQLTIASDEDLQDMLVSLHTEIAIKAANLVPVCEHDIDRSYVMLELLRREIFHRAELRGFSNHKTPDIFP